MHGGEKGSQSSTPTSRGCISQVVTPHLGTRGMDVTTQEQDQPGGGGGRAQSMAKPRPREANIDKKYRRKQENIDI